MEHGISKLDLKRQNRMHVLKILKQRGPTSRIDIAGALELTRAAVTIITNEMIEQGIIVELGEYKHVAEKTPRGRKKILIDINHNFKFTIGITIEADLVSIGLATLAGAALDKRNLTIAKNVTLDEIASFIKKSVKAILTDNCIEESQLLGVGIGVYPGMFDKLGIPVENGVPDYTAMRNLFSQATKLPIVIDNSVKGMAMANIDFTKIKDSKRQNIAFLQYGDSMHFVVTNLNDPIVSYDNRTDFVDRIVLNPTADVVCECGRRGCCRSEISPAAIIKKVAEVFSAEKTPYLFKVLSGDTSRIATNNIMESYNKNDEGTVKVINRVLDLTGVLLNNLYFTTNPQKIVLDNFMFTDDTVLNERFKEAVERIGGKTVAERISLSIIDDKQRFLSGCALAIRELFFNKGGFVKKV